MTANDNRKLHRRPLTTDDIEQYRATYDADAWERCAAENGGYAAMPWQAALAVQALCDEIERLQALLEAR